ncbi:MAG TPA: class I SAM-dependent methyltransferase, partial [Acidimicrobiales bacterium]|nr:class I SAM-dependent methyltransferase [Acidimicrobiales bacterium]
ALAEYSDRYEETQGFSPRFREFATELATRWIDRYEIRGRRVLEIGCGKGEFLELICELGGNRGIGIDPGVHPERLGEATLRQVEFVADFYDERYAHLEADVVVCRHTLEHIAPVAEFMNLVRRGIGDRLGTVVLFELPDVLRVLNEGAFYDVYYEHCSYFSAGSLARLFRACGFDPVDISRAYDDQYLLIEARPAKTALAPGPPLALEDDLAEVTAGVGHFLAAREATLRFWRERIEQAVERSGRVVLWGSGSKAVAFLAGIDLAGAVSEVVDINPFKHGKYLPGSGARIVAPEALADLHPSLVVAMNPIYREEIQRDLDRLGVATELAAV